MKTKQEKLLEIKNTGGIMIDDEFYDSSELHECDLCHDIFGTLDLKWNYKATKLYCKKCSCPNE